MTIGEKRTILLSLVGTAPAVLTETVWALAHQDEPVIPDRIVAMTTTTGAAKLKEKLFREERWAEMLNDLSADGVDHKDSLKFGPIADCIRVFPDLSRSFELEDIRTTADNEAVAEFFMETIRGFVENDSTRLIVSIAGGRKTTSALLYSVMSLLGRHDDQIQHILVDDVWTFQPDFMYPGCKGVFVDKMTNKSLSSSDAELQIVDVPFVPLRYMFGKDLEQSAGSFRELVNQVRARSIGSGEDLEVQMTPATGDLNVNGMRVTLSPNEYLLYLYFACRASEGEPPVDGYSAIGEELQDLKDEHLSENDFSHWTHKALAQEPDPSEDFRKWMHSIRSKLKALEFEGFQIDRLVPKGRQLAITVPKDSISIDS